MTAAALRSERDGDLVVRMTKQITKACGVPCEHHQTISYWTGPKGRYIYQDYEWSRPYLLRGIRHVYVEATRPASVGTLTIWRGGWKTKVRAEPGEPWFAVRVERWAWGDSERWLVSRTVSVRDGSGVRHSGSARSSARFVFEGEGPTFEDAEFECVQAEQWLEDAESSGDG
ncbi:MAG TPA: hypothetical protein VFT98_03590 [Myxococcota bacterium]|nr:hypothetical protein [Myxococcota bacterium]